MKLNSLFSAQPTKVQDVNAPRASIALSYRDRALALHRLLVPRTDRVEPVVASDRNDESSTSIRMEIHNRAKMLAKRMPTVRQLVGNRTPSMRGETQHASGRRIRRDYHVVVTSPTPEKLQKMRWVILPRSTWKVRWDMWIGFIISYSVTMIPYRIGFAIDLEQWEQIINYFFDASFALDVIFNFFTGFYDEDTFIYELSKIRVRYIKSWFIFDLVSTLPMDQFFEAVTSANDATFLSLKLLRTVRLFRLLKLMRLLRLKRAFDTIQMDALNAHFLQTIKTLLMIIFIIHLVACAWYMFYTWDPNGTNWVTTINVNGIPNPYLVSFYWVANTMMSVGYGDIYGVSDSERVFSMFVECLGSICVGLIIANIQMLTENYNPRGVKMRQKVQETKEFLIKRSIPRRLRQRIISQFEYHWNRRTVFEEDELLRRFPRSLQYEILAASMDPFVKRFPFFGLTSVDFFVYTVPRLRPIVVGLGQALVEAESVWEEVYFMTSGSMDVMRGSTVACTLASGDICGIEYLVGNRKRYVHTYRSTAKSELYAIYSVDLITAATKCPLASKYFYDLSHIIAERYADAARRGTKALQRKDEPNRRASVELFLQQRNRRSPSFGSIVQLHAEELRRMHNLGEGEEMELHWSVLRHYSRTRIAWDMIMGVMVAWTALSVPYRISFDVRDTMLLSVTDRVSDLLFGVDIAINFVTTYVDETGVEIVNRHDIRRHYLKTSFVVDVVSTIPFDFIIESVAGTGDFRSLKLLRTVKLVKLLRLMRIIKLFKLNSQWISELDISMDSIRLLKLLAPVMMIAHYVGCFWYYMSADHDPENAWWGNVHFDDANSTVSRYIASVYWATTTMATVGFGDIYAVNNYEQAYSILVMIGGTTLFAYVVGTVIEVVSNSKSLMNREHEIGQQISAYIKERGVSKEFALACQEHVRYMNAEKTLFHEPTLFDALCHSLRGELILHLNNNVLSKIRFFDKKPKWFLTLLLPRLVPQYFLAGDLLIYQNNLVGGIYFLMSGAVIARVPPLAGDNQERPGGCNDQGPTMIRMETNGRMTDAVPDRDGNVATLYEGEFFGYKEVLTRTAAMYNAFASRPTGTYMLPAERLDEIQETYPDVLEEMRSLFLHSITKQQTILQHWHKNAIMGIFGQERERIMRVGGTIDETTTSEAESDEAEALEGSEHDSPPTRSLADDVEGDDDHAADRAVSSKCDQDVVTALPTFPAVRRSSLLGTGGPGGTPLFAPTPNMDDGMTELKTGPNINSVPLTDDERPVTPPDPVATPEHQERVEFNPKATFTRTVSNVKTITAASRGPRRSSFVTPPRPDFNPPPLLRYPSMPHEINDLVNRLLEVEGYIIPGTEDQSTGSKEQQSTSPSDETTTDLPR